MRCCRSEASALPERKVALGQGIEAHPPGGDACVGPKLYHLVANGDRGKAKHFPLVGLGEQESCQVVHMDALHDDDDGARSFVVEAGQQGVVEPLIG